MATKDVEMTDAAQADTKAAPQTTSKNLETAPFTAAELRKHSAFLERAVDTADTRPVGRVLRSLGTVRKKLTPAILREYINAITGNSEAPEQVAFKEALLSQLSGFMDEAPEPTITASTPSTNEATPMDLSDGTEKKDAREGEAKDARGNKEPTPRPIRFIAETEIYARLLVVILLLDKEKLEEALAASVQLVDIFTQKQLAAPRSLEQFTSRTLNPLSAKVFFYYARTHELLNRSEEIRSKLLALHRTATLRHNDEGAVTLLNLLLRNYLHYNLYDQADKLISKVLFKEEAASNNEFARYLYYQGKIKSVQLDYADAYSSLLGAMRKAPQHSARGFRLAVTKLACIVQCLIGEIPERSLFRQPGLKKPLVPYLELVKAVRIGDLNAFHEVINRHGTIFHADKTYTLIQRLRHNVIKTGLRKINLSYSKISLEDIRVKLQLDSVEDVEFIAAKAIRDKVINAIIDHQGKFLQTKEIGAGYTTDEPQIAFHRRITFCLNTHNDAVKAMRFPPDVHKPASLETAKERREREQEIAKNLAEDEEDDF